MDTKIPVIFVLALAVGASMWIGSGIASEFTQTDPADGLSSPDRLEDEANDSAVSDDGGFSGSVESSDDESSIVGLIISGSHAIADIAAFVVLLPLELRNLGFPRWFAYPIGLAVQILGGVGIIQFATNRPFR